MKRIVIKNGYEPFDADALRHMIESTTNDIQSWEKQLALYDRTNPRSHGSIQILERYIKTGKRDIKDYQKRLAALSKRNPKKNPYRSQAQRRKFHAMAERGEISQATVDKYDRESEGLDLPERVGNPNGTWLHNYAKKEWYYIVNGIHIGHIYFQDKLYSASVYPDGNVGVYKSILRAKAAVEKHAKELTHTPYRNPRKRQTMRERCEEMLHGKEQEPTFSYYRDVENPSKKWRTVNDRVFELISGHKVIAVLQKNDNRTWSVHYNFDPVDQLRTIYADNEKRAKTKARMLYQRKKVGHDFFQNPKHNGAYYDLNRDVENGISLTVSEYDENDKGEPTVEFNEEYWLTRKRGGWKYTGDKRIDRKLESALIAAAHRYEQSPKFAKAYYDRKRNPDHKKRFAYKGFTCIWNKEKQAYDIFTKDEMEQPAGTRYPDFEMETEQGAKEWIDSYDDF